MVVVTFVLSACEAMFQLPYCAVNLFHLFLHFASIANLPTVLEKQARIMVNCFPCKKTHLWRHCRLWLAVLCWLGESAWPSCQLQEMSMDHLEKSGLFCLYAHSIVMEMCFVCNEFTNIKPPYKTRDFHHGAADFCAKRTSTFWLFCAWSNFQQEWSRN